MSLSCHRLSPPALPHVPAFSQPMEMTIFPENNNTSPDTELYKQPRAAECRLLLVGHLQHQSTLHCTGFPCTQGGHCRSSPPPNPAQVTSSSGKEAVNTQLCPGSLWVTTEPATTFRRQTSTATLDLVLECKTKALKLFQNS